jgi:hypothetical protein
MSLNNRFVRVIIASGWTVLTWALLIGSAGLNVMQARRIGILQSIVSQMKGEFQLAVGAHVPALQVRTLDGRLVEVGFDAVPTPTVVYYFSPTCGWCARNLNNIKSLSDAARGFRFIGVSATDKGLNDYLKTTELVFPVYINPSTDSNPQFKFSGTPGTLVISRDGVVLKNWPGAYTGDDEKDVEHYFGVALPGLIAIPEHAPTAAQAR